MPDSSYHSGEKRAQNLRKEAARWFLRMRNSEPDHPDRSKFEAWLMGNPEHAREYSAISAVWADFDSTPQLQSLAQAIEHKTCEVVGKRKLDKLLGKNLLTILLVFISSLFGFHMWKDYISQPVYQVTSNTGIGEIGHQMLTDGTQLVLNANTQIKVVYYRDKRTVEINRGEVIFDVTSDSSRPFIVDSGHARVTVLGTRFVVNRLSDLVRVSVDHGSVKVAAQDQQKHIREPYLVLHDGEVAEVNVGGAPYRVKRDAVDAFTFQRGVLTFRQAHLSEIAETLSRYRTSRVTATILGQQSTRITAVVQITEMENFINVLPQIAPVRIKKMGNEIRLIDLGRH